MSSGIKIEEVVIGTGALAERGKDAIVRFAGFLNRGEQVLGTPADAQPARIRLGERECLVGLEQGILGMRVGGRRKLVVSPHLAYGEKGVERLVPPNAVLRFEVELVDVLERGVLRPEEVRPGRWLSLHRPGEAARGLAQWQLSLGETGVGHCSVTRLLPAGTWRAARTRWLPVRGTPAEAVELIDRLQALPQTQPGECLAIDDCYADTSEPGNSITRDRTTRSLCLTVRIAEQQALLCGYVLRETSPAWCDPRLQALLAPYLACVEPPVPPARPPSQFRWTDD